jgi:hypothetical protein
MLGQIRKKLQRKNPKKIVDPMEQSLDEPNAGLEPAASRLEVSRATYDGVSDEPDCD